MSIRSVVGLFLLLVLTCPGSAQVATDASNQRAILQQILAQNFPPSEVGKKVMGLGKETDVRKPGGIIVVQREGLFGSLERNEIASSSIHGLQASLFRGHKDYAVPVGERFYVTAIFVGQSTIMIGLLSARSVSSPEGAGHVWSAASFNFDDKTLAEADKETVLREIEAWFVMEGRAASTMAPAAPAVVPADAPGTTPLPAALPASLHAGMAREELLAALGKPQREVNFQGQTWLYYPGMVALLRDGKLASIEQSGPASATLTLRSDPPGAEIYLDGQLISSTPATFEVAAGNHQLTLKLDGYQDWSRDIHVLSGSSIHFEPTLEKK